MATIKAAEKLSNANFYIVISLITLLVLGGTALVAKTLFTTVVRNSRVITAKNKANNQLDKNVANAPALVSAYAALSPQQNLINDALPETVDYPGLLALVENMSISSGTSLKTVTPSDSIPTTSISSSSTSSGTESIQPQNFGFTFTVEGSYTNILKLLTGLETSARPIQVKALQLSGSSSDLNVMITANTYYQAKATLPITKETIK